MAAKGDRAIGEDNRLDDVWISGDHLGWRTVSPVRPGAFATASRWPDRQQRPSRGEPHAVTWRRSRRARFRGHPLLSPSGGSRRLYRARPKFPGGAGGSIERRTWCEPSRRSHRTATGVKAGPPVTVLRRRHEDRGPMPLEHDDRLPAASRFKREREAEDSGPDHGHVGRGTGMNWSFRASSRGVWGVRRREGRNSPEP